MSSEFDLRRVIVQCAETNLNYMDRRAGEAGFPKMVALYRRIAEDSLSLAKAYAEGSQKTSLRNPQSSRAAVDAFWWAVHGWTVMFTADVLRTSPIASAQGEFTMGRINHEIQEKFCRAHLQFAQWLRPVGNIQLYEPPDLSGVTPGSLILRHDYYWTRHVIYLTARWGLLQHLKDIPALLETWALLKRLRRWPTDPVALAYLESDLAFLKELFSHFQFSPDVQRIFDRFLQRSHEEADEWRQWEYHQGGGDDQHK